MSQDRRSIILPNVKIFEEFFVIGVEEETLSKCEGIVSFLDPDTLYSHFKDQVKEGIQQRRKVIKDFCFPDKVPIRKLNGIHEARDLMKYKPQPISFVFTMNANEDETDS